ncbi:ubiquinol oxidase 1a, mitochondrial isoform X2 [Gossypium hirsutum]|uniref:Ubiquinol oxidase n=1 Tax=Gossypium hirsutum TaxID=3635 RepID=A0A1U8MSW7_GOSHI|nr:ubiquinol oxidase 1a, mitochondrial isoform X2 [Gossypium hirsutum]
MMMSRGYTRLASSMFTMVSPRFFSTAATRGVLSNDMVKAPAVGLGVRCRSSMAAIGGGDKEQEKKQAVGGGGGSAKDDKEIVSYWGLDPTKVSKEDGSPWKWTCFRRRYGCRAMMLETVAAVPGMVGGMLLHCKSLRRFEHSGGWIKALLEEAENERMHLMTFMEVSDPRWYERALVFSVQGVFFNAYFLGYIISPKFAHRVVGYLEEEAIHSYTEFLKELDNGNIENVPAPPIAIDYWRLSPNSTLRDVVLAVRADEAHHRDVNHFASDIHYQGRQLKEAPAPLGYH